MAGQAKDSWQLGLACLFTLFIWVSINNSANLFSGSSFLFLGKMENGHKEDGDMEHPVKSSAHKVGCSFDFQSAKWKFSMVFHL